MSNFTNAVDQSVIQRARMRAIQEGRLVSARLREFLADCAQGQAAVLVAREERPVFEVAPAATRAPRPAAWLHALRERVESFGGIEPEEWLPARDAAGPRPLNPGV